MKKLNVIMIFAVGIVGLKTIFLLIETKLTSHNILLSVVVISPVP